MCFVCVLLICASEMWVLLGFCVCLSLCVVCVGLCVFCAFLFGVCVC